MRFSHLLRNTTILSTIVLPLSLAGAIPSAMAQDAPAQSELQKHDTTPGGQYVPQQDVLGERPMDRYGKAAG